MLIMHLSMLSYRGGGGGGEGVEEGTGSTFERN